MPHTCVQMEGHIVRRSVLAICLSMISSAASSQASQEIVRTALNNVGHEMAECAAYSIIVAAALSKAPGAEAGVQGYRNRADVLLGKAVVVAEEIKQKPETVYARFAISFDAMNKKIGHDFVNFSILSSEYGEHCKVVAEDTEGRLKYWVNEVLSSRGRRK